eukprot:superscaffoldBa00000186_g2513
MSNLRSNTDSLMGPLQFTYRANRCVDDTVNISLHFILQHLDSSGTCARIVFVNFSSAFNTISLVLLQDQLSQLNVSDSTYRWIIVFLSDRRQHVKLGKCVSDSLTISTCPPKGCVFSPRTPTAAPPVISPSSS